MYVRGGAANGLSWASYNESLKPRVARCVSEHLSTLARLLSETTDLKVIMSVADLLPLAGPECVQYVRPLMPHLTDKYQIEHAAKVLDVV